MPSPWVCTSVVIRTITGVPFVHEQRDEVRKLIDFVFLSFTPQCYNAAVEFITVTVADGEDDKAAVQYVVCRTAV